jgi:hypothetical protein
VDRLTSLMLRASFVWLVAGVTIGSAMLAAGPATIPGLGMFRAAHLHMLLVGWLIQFALGVGYWLFPRKRTPDNPLGYRETIGLVSMAALNAGLALRVIFELVRVQSPGAWTQIGLSASGALQALAIVAFAVQLWPRVATRPAKPAAVRAGGQQLPVSATHEDARK